MKRIVVVGCAGAGKSTFAIQLGPLLKVPVFHLDAVFWQPGWRRVPEEIQHAFINNFAPQGTWIVEGDHLPTQPMRFKFADTIIFFDFSASLCLWRALKRWWRFRGRGRSGGNAGCLEYFNLRHFKWIWDYPTSHRPHLLANIEAYQHGRRVIVFYHPREAQQFLESVMRKEKS